MNILMFNYEFPPIGGGAGNANLEILRQFSKHKIISIDLITSSPDKKDRIENFSDNIKIHKLDVQKKEIQYWTAREVLSYTIKSFFYAKKLMKQKKYDVCHCFFAMPCGMIAYLLRNRIRYIVSLRGSDVPGFNERLKFSYFFQKPIIREVWDKAEYVVANSQGLKELALKTNPKQEVSIIYNGIDTSKFYPGIKKQKKDITILCVSRLIPRKGLNYLIDAIPAILKQNENIKLIIAGEGPEKKNLEKQAAQYNIKSKIDFLGYVSHEDLPAIYFKSDIFILPSLHEGMSNTILEAMASGLPIITTNTGGTKELINENGIIIEKNSPADISAAVIKLIKDTKLRKEMSFCSRELSQKLSWGKIAEDYLKLYNKTYNTSIKK
jgi:L-malate glycosyltransferase